MGGGLPLLATLSFATIFIVPAAAAAGGFGWEDNFTDLFEIAPIPDFGSGTGGPGETKPGFQPTVAETRPKMGLTMGGINFSLLDPKDGEDDGDRSRWANFSLVLPPGWRGSVEGGRNEGRLVLEGPCALASIGWFEDFGVDPDGVLRQVVRGYRSEPLGFSVLTAEQSHPVEVDGQRGSTLNVYYRRGGHESSKRLVAWSSPVSGRFFFASFWSCPESWDENLERFEGVIESFRDEGSERYAVLQPRSPVLDGWGTVLSLTLLSYHFSSRPPTQNPEVGVKVVIKSRREGGRIDDVACEEIVSLRRRAEAPAGEVALQKLLLDGGYGAILLRRGGAFWVAVQGPEGNWQPISPAADGAVRGVGSLVRPEEGDWYRGMVVDGVNVVRGLAGEDGSLGGASIEKDCDPPRMVDLPPAEAVDPRWILGLRDLLDRYTYAGEEDDPDSSHRTQVSWALLEGEGYDALLMEGYEGHPLHPRMWVAVRDPEGGYVAVDPAAGGHRGLGEVVFADDRFYGIGYDTSLQFSCLCPDRGLSIDPGSVRTEGR